VIINARIRGRTVNGLRAGVGLAAAILAFATDGCSSNPTAPAPPPIVINTPPVIESITVSSDRVDADQHLDVTALVHDGETPLDQLTYSWSAAPVSGTFTGAGAAVKWHAPKQQTTPDLYTLTLTVTESYTSAGQPKRNQVSLSAQVHYNDSSAEVTALASQFLADFGTFEVSPEQCVRNFSNSCRGKQDELGQIQGNRANYHIQSSAFAATKTTFDSARTAGTIEGPCVFEDVPNSGQPNAGRRERISGTCFMTTVYENFRWLLCDSLFLPPFSQTLESLRYRVPGHALSQ
jgi:hypothetical protein